MANRGKRCCDTAYSHHVSGRTSLLVTSEVDKSRDMNLLSCRLHPSEIAWQSFMLGAIADRVPSSAMRFIAIHCILNENTQDTIFETTRRSTSTHEREDGHKEYTELDRGFLAILGSVLGKSAVNMMLDHKSEMGY